jgi:hypothetical protein
MKIWNAIWIVAAGIVVLYVLIGFASANPVKKLNTSDMPDTSLLRLSEQLLYSVKTELPTNTLESELANLNMKQLTRGLNNDESIKTFWINMYNAWFQILAGRERMTRPAIFTAKTITIAGKKFSLDNIEHDILRRYRWKYSLGYFPRFFPGRLIKQLAVSTIDYRIHFALNCGAKSCPPITFYQYENINTQLDLATRNFLKTETEVDIEKKKLTTSKILSWFRGDFGGKKGVRKIIGEVLGKDLTGYTVRFKEYDWSRVLGNYRE